MKSIARLTLVLCLLRVACLATAPAPEPVSPTEEVLRFAGEVGAFGGRLVIGQRS